MKYLLLPIILILSACSTTVPVKRTFPEAPAVLLEKCAELRKVKENAQLSDVVKTVAENYSICLQNAQQLSSLQKYIIEVNKKIDDENKKRGIDIDLPELPWKKKEG